MILGQPATLKPANGIPLRKPDGSYLAAEGETVIVDSYWLRRENDGDVEEIIADASAPISNRKAKD